MSRLGVRRKCLRDGHKFLDTSVLMPYLYCSRWFCKGAAVSAWVNPDAIVDLHNAIPIEIRYPPVWLDEDGNAVEY